MKRLRLAIVSTHPIQYYAPVFRALAGSDRVEPRVFFTWSQTEGGEVMDREFGLRIAWNVPLRDGYDHVFVPNVSRHPTSSRFDGIRNPSLLREIESWAADAILVYGWKLHSHLAAIRHFKGRIPVLFRGDSTLLRPVGRVRGVLRRLSLRWVYAHVDVAVAVGQHNRDYYRWSGVPARRIAFAPHSVDTGRFKDPSGRQDAHAVEWRARLGIPEGAVAFLFAAKFSRTKDPLLLIDAFKRLEAGIGGQDTRACLVMVGSGELEAALRARAGGMDSIHFLPFQNQAEMPSAYRIGDAYVLPSRGETWGLAVNEAMASGRPVIVSSRVGAARDLVQPGSTGWIFESGDTAALTAVLRAALGVGRAGLARMGLQARGLIDGWSSEAAADAIAAAVAAACAGRSS